MRQTKKRNKGFTITELTVSSCVMCLVAVTTTSVLVTSAKITKAAVSTSEQNMDGRQAFDRLVADVRESDAVLADVTLDKAYALDPSSTVILRKPATDMAGNVLPNAFDVTVYEIVASPDTKKYGDQVMRKVTCRVTNGVNAAVKVTPVEMPCVGKVNFQWLRAESIDWNSGSFSLPGRVVFGEPTGTQIGVKGATLARLNLALDQTDLTTGIVSLVKAGVSLDLSGTQVSVPTSTATDKLDIVYAFDLASSNVATRATKANLAKIDVVQLIPKELNNGKDDKTVAMTAETKLRNAN